LRYAEANSSFVHLFGHDLRANASRLSRAKTGIHFSGSCPKILLQRFQARRALLPCREPALHRRIGLMLLKGGQKPMRWKISHRGHDPRHLDLIAALALVIAIVAVCRFISGGSQAPSAATFIVPSQSVRW
jgi:hypothetical protein